MTQPYQGQGPQQGNFAPPPPGQGGYGPPQGQWGPPPPPKKKHTARNVLLGVIGLIIVIAIIATAAGGGGSKKSTTSPAPSANSSNKQQTGPLDHSADVKITSCATDPTLSAPTAKLTVTNSSSKPSDYAITVAFESKDGATQYDTGNAFVQNLGPGQSTTQDAPSLKQGIPAGFICKVVSADRTSAIG